MKREKLTKKKISVVIPAHNEEKNVERMVNLLFKNFRKDIFELIVIDDVSTDKTGVCIDKLARKNKKIVCVHRKKDGGVGNAMRKGLSLVSPKTDYVLMLDCDFVENISDIKRLVKSIKSTDGVLGSRYMEGGVLVNYPFAKKIANRLFHFLVHIFLGIRHVDLTNNFKLYRREVIEDIKPLLISSGFSINAETGLYPLLLGYQLNESPVSWIGRTKEMGTSNFKVLKAGPGYVKILCRVCRYKLFGLPKNKVPLETSERIHFDSLIKKVGETYYGNLKPMANLRFKRKAKDILSKIDSKKKLKILEIGCGTGVLSKSLLLREKTLSITGIDISPEAIKIADKNLGKYPNTSFVVGSVLKMPFRTNNFDVVIGNSILHHLPLNLVLREIDRVLKPNGFFWFSEPNFLNPQIFLEKNVPILKSMLQDSKDEKAFTRWQLEKTIKRIGFNEVAVEPYEFLHPVLPAKLVKLALLMEKLPVIKEFAGTLKIYGIK